MASQSTANNTTGAQLSSVPAIHSFEFDKDAIGQIKTSVNQFRGSVSLPITFMTLPGRQDLDVKIATLYSSNVRQSVSTWNVEAPTGIIGLGWQMPYDYITVNKNNSGSSVGDEFYLVSNGSANPMVKVGQRDSVWFFQLRNYEFWDVEYDTTAQKWTIVKEDGSVTVYGDQTTSAVQWGVRWGNWIGSSAVRAGQVRYPVAWNLLSASNVWGNTVIYEYDNVEFGVGSQDGMKFTQASYVKKITDSFGRIVTFNYGEKYGARNPSPRGIIEYQAQNSARPEPNAYQNKYETRFLDSVTVANPQGELLTTLRFTYDFLNTAATGDPNYNLLWKRVLRSVFQEAPDGTVLPSMRFTYNGRDDTNPGSMATVLYPEGGTARYTYKKLFIQAPKKITISNPLSGAEPGVWHGSDYVVFTWVVPGGGMKVSVASWNGRWVQQDITATAMFSAKIDASTVWVSAQADSIAISYRNTATGSLRDELFLYRRDRSQFGGWKLYNNSAINLSLTGTPGPSQFIGGVDYVIAFNTAYSGSAFQGFSWDFRVNAWTTPVPLPSSSDARAASGVSMAASSDYYIVTMYTTSTKTAKFQIFYRDLGRTWNSNTQWTNTGLDVLIEEGRLLWVWNPQPAYAVGTYVTGSTSNTISYTLRTFQWNESFFVQNSNSPAIVNLTTQVNSDTPQYSIFKTLVSAALVSNNPSNQRDVGGDLSTGSSANWLRKDFTPASKTSTLNFTSGDDVSVMAENNAGSQRNQLLVFDPNISSSAGWSFPSISQSGTVPTVSTNYLTIGTSIYFRKTDGTWTLLSQPLTYLGAADSVQNRGPGYIAYQTSLDASARSYVIFLQNGGAGLPVQLGGTEKIYVPASDTSRGGTQLAGRFLVSYPSSSTSFNKATSLNLYNLDESTLSDYAYDYPVAYIEILNPFDATASFTQSYFYGNSETSQIAYNPATAVAQYPLVFAVRGVKSNNDTPPTDQPEGRSAFYYSNGLSPQTSLGYPQGWIYNYQDILNGLLLSQQDFNSDNVMVQSQTNYWQVYTIDASTSMNLYGAYARLIRTDTGKDGVVQNSYVDIDVTTGLPKSQDVTYCDTNGTMKRLRTSTKYATQVDQYKQMFLAAHYYSAVAQSTQSVTDSTGTNPVYISSKVTTWKDWVNTGAAKLAPVEIFQWTAAPSSSEPVFDFGAGSNAGFRSTSKIISRLLPEGMIQEQIDTNQVRSSFVYDKDQRYLIAKFPAGSIEGGEVMYTGFESYETDQGWALGAGAAVVPNNTHPQIDAHSGTNSVRIEAATSGSTGLTRTFNPTDQQRSYVFSAWVKKPTGFDSGSGDASWSIAVSGGSTTSLNFPATIGQWVYVAQTITLSGSGVTISVNNANTGSYVLADDVRFTPLSCLFEATPYDTLIWMPNVLLGANGESGRTIYDQFEQTIYQTNSADLSSKITRGYFSRTGNEGLFSAHDPDATVELRPLSGGTLYTFNDGDEWADLWTANPANSWHVDDGRLTQSASSGALQITDSGYTNEYAIAASFEISEAVTKPLGCHFGSSVTIQWDPETLRWQLLDGNSAPLLPAVSTREFSVPSTPYTAQLDAGQISSDLQQAFLDAGYPLPDDSTVAAGSTQAKQWVITGPDPDQPLRYYLLPEGATIGVYQPGTEWTFFVGENTVLFWVAGRRIFSYESTGTLSAAPELFFGNKVSISALLTGLQPQVRVNFDDASGGPLQSQLLDGQQASVAMTISDSMGRQAIRTKAAYVEGTDAAPLMAYRSDFAVIDWNTWIMTGLVAAAYPDDDGYPYSRSVFESSPLDRVIEQGLPGSLFRVGAHSAKFTYSADNGTFGLPPKQFFKTTLVNPNGDTSYEIQSQLQQTVGKVSIKKSGTADVQISNQTLFNAAGNPYNLRSPNYFLPPDGSTASDWVVFQTFDYAGRVSTSKYGTGGTTQLIYDPAGRLRFMQDPEGATDGNYNYWKYDSLGRLTESGYISGTWNTGTLQNTADTDPAAPPTPSTWRTKNYYDDPTLETRSIGRVYKVEVNNGNAGATDATQTYAYDIYGNTSVTSLNSTEYNPDKTLEVEYEYDNVGNILQITYPEAADQSRLTVYYRYGALSRVTAVSTEADFASPLVTFDYSAPGLPQTETYANGVVRDYTFNSPLWIQSITDKKSDAVLFGEEVSYTEDGYNGAAYYDGTVAATAFQSTSGGTPYDFKYSYDSVGQIQNGASSQHPTWDLGVTKPVSYDANGNFIDCALGGTDRTYQYFPGKQALQKVVDGGNATLAQYQYDKNGNAIEADSFAGGAATHDLAISYDPGSKLTTSIADSASGGKTLDFQYGDFNQRIVKAVYQGTTLIGKKLYMRGVNPLPLYESSTDGTETLYIYGPNGLLAMRRAAKQYTMMRDHLGSIRRVADESAAIVASYDYLPFGTISDVSEPSTGFMTYLYTGQEYDSEVALYNYRARFYDSTIGRFLAVDPRAQFFSPYIYGANNPVLYVDPSGAFSLKSFFSAIGGAIIGAVEILIGVAIDAVAGVLEVITGGLATPVAVALASAAGAFYGAGISSISYSVFNFNDFSWKDYGIQMGIGAAIGAISFGFGALGGVVAESATGVQAAIKAGVEVSKAAQAASKAIQIGFNVAGGIVSTSVVDAITGTTPGADLGWSALTNVLQGLVPAGPAFKAGWGNLGKRVLIGAARNEVIGLSVAVSRNAAEGNDLSQGLLQAATTNALWGSVGSLKARDAAQRTTQDVVNSFAAFSYGFSLD